MASTQSKPDRSPGPFREPIRLGRTDLSVSPMGIGVWAWGSGFYWGYGSDFEEQDAREAFHTCVQAGINFFDTAEIYGSGCSERLLGAFAQEVKKPLVITSKFMPFPWRLSRRTLRRALRASLRRLGREILDLYLIHHPLPPVPIPIWMEAMADAVEEGLIRAVGVSNFNLNQMRLAADALARRGIPLAANQVPYSPLSQSIETEGLLEAAREMGVAVVAYSPLEQGLLTGKYSPQNPPGGVRGLRFRGDSLQQLGVLLERMREIGEAHGGKTPAQVALNWTLCKGTIPIPGVKRKRQAEENLGALGWRLTTAEVEALGKLGRDLVRG